MKLRNLYNFFSISICFLNRSRRFEIYIPARSYIRDLQSVNLLPLCETLRNKGQREDWSGIFQSWALPVFFYFFNNKK